MLRGVAKLLVPHFKQAAKFSTIGLIQRTSAPVPKPCMIRFLSTETKAASEYIKELKSAEDWEKSIEKKAGDATVIMEFYAKYE